MTLGLLGCRRASFPLSTCLHPCSFTSLGALSNPAVTMQIRDDFDFTDPVTGLRIRAIKGDFSNRLHIDIVGLPVIFNRDLWFTPGGDFDGTGSRLGESP